MKRFLIAVALLSTLTTAGMVQAGALGGPKEGVGKIVSAHSTREFDVIFRGGEMGSVILSGDHDTDLDLYIFDGAGRLVASDDDNTDTCLGTWYVSRTQQYTVRVVNRGSVYNEFDLFTN